MRGPKKVMAALSEAAEVLAESHMTANTYPMWVAYLFEVLESEINGLGGDVTDVEYVLVKAKNVINERLKKGRW